MRATDIGIERSGAALLVRRAGADAAAAQLAASARPERRRVPVVVGESAAGPVAALDDGVLDRLAATLAEHPEPGVRLLVSRSGGAPDTLAPRLAGRLGVEVTAPDGDLLVLDDGHLFVTGDGGWVTHTAAGATLRGGPRAPAPWWQADLPSPATADGVSVTPAPVGLWVRHAGAGPRPLADPVLAVVPDAQRPVLVAGAPGEPGPDVTALAALVRSLPQALRDVAVLAVYGPDSPRSPLAQRLADELAIPVRGLHGMPGHDGARTILLDADGEPTWEPFAQESLYTPGAAPTVERWVAPVAGLEPAGPRAYRLADGWHVEVLPSGLLVRPASTRVDPAWRRAGSDAARVDLAVTGAGLPLDAVARLARDLGDDARSRLRVRTVGDALVDLDAVRHAVGAPVARPRVELARAAHEAATREAAARRHAAEPRPAGDVIGRPDGTGAPGLRSGGSGGPAPLVLDVVTTSAAGTPAPDPAPTPSPLPIAAPTAPPVPPLLVDRDTDEPVASATAGAPGSGGSGVLADSLGVPGRRGPHPAPTGVGPASPGPPGHAARHATGAGGSGAEPPRRPSLLASIAAAAAASAAAAAPAPPLSGDGAPPAGHVTTGRSARPAGDRARRAARSRAAAVVVDAAGRVWPAPLVGRHADRAPAAPSTPHAPPGAGPATLPPVTSRLVPTASSVSAPSIGAPRPAAPPAGEPGVDGRRPAAASSITAALAPSTVVPSVLPSVPVGPATPPPAAPLLIGPTGASGSGAAEVTAGVTAEVAAVEPAPDAAETVADDTAAAVPEPVAAPAQAEVPADAAGGASDEHRRRFRAAVGWRYDTAIRAVTRLLAERPGLRGAGAANAAALTELAAVQVYAADPTAGFDPAFAACLASGLRRLPTLRGVVVRGGPDDPAAVDALVVGSVVRLATPTVAVADLDAVTPGGVSYLVWSLTARRLDGLVDEPRADEVVLAAGSEFRVLAVDAATESPRHVLLAELAPSGDVPLTAQARLGVVAAARRVASAAPESRPAGPAHLAAEPRFAAA